MKYFLVYDTVATCWVVYERIGDGFIVLDLFNDLFDAVNYYMLLLDIG